MKKFLLGLVMSLAFAVVSHAQEEQTHGLRTMGLGVQFYPAGTIIHLKSGWTISPKEELTGKLGYNIARRQDFGEHDKEEGGGPGFTLSYKRYLKTGFKGWFAEARAGMWFLDIDWEDNTPAASGNTDITVFQPTLGIGYSFPLAEEKFKLDLLIAFGFEVNVVTSGQEVGQGGISLIGATFSLPINGKKKGRSSKRPR